VTLGAAASDAPLPITEVDGHVFQRPATSTLFLSGSAQSIAGAGIGDAYGVSHPGGALLIFGHFSFQGSNVDAEGIGEIVAGGVVQALAVMNFRQLNSTVQYSSSASCFFYAPSTSADSDIYLRAYRSGGSGGSVLTSATALTVIGV
jgi:hypothetical protein